MVCAYRLIDVLYDLQEAEQEHESVTSYGRPVYGKLRLSKHLPNQVRVTICWKDVILLIITSGIIQFWPLHDWVKLLREAKSKIESLQIFETSPASGTDEDSALTTTISAGLMPLNLFKGYFKLSKNEDALKVLCNIQIAALHLACMFKGTATSDDRLVKFLSLAATLSRHY
jgi:hypothetical protein